MSEAITGQTVLDDNGYTVTDFPIIVVERLINKAISHINAQTGRSIAHMDGTAGTKSVTVADEEYGVLDAIITCMLREAKKTALSNSSSTGGSSGSSKSVSAQGYSVSESSSTSSAITATSAINNSGNSILIDWIKEELKRLREIEVSYG
jgi:hypothetical protein